MQSILVRIFRRIANEPLLSEAITILKASMVRVIFRTIFGILCSNYGEASSALNAPVWRGTIHELWSHEEIPVNV
jgi:hypothetical protein